MTAEAMHKPVRSSSLWNVRTMAKVAILAVLAAVLMLLEFPVAFAPAFVRFDFSEVPVLIGGFALGPAAAVLIEAIKILLNFLLNGTITMGIGELANFVIGCAFVFPAALIYQHHKTRRTAVIGMIVGTLCMTVVGMLANYYVLIPAYISIAQFPEDAIISMGQAINPAITDIRSLVVLSVTPFNLFKGAVISLITFLLYKHVSPLLHR